MEIRKAVISVLQLFSMICFFGGGLFFLSLAFLPSLALRVAYICIHSSSVCTSIGVGLLIAASLLLVGFYVESRGRFLRIRMGGHRASIHRAVIHKMTEECFSRHFPKKAFVSDIHIFWGKKLEIEILMTPLQEEMDDEIFTDIENHLTMLLREKFGYFGPFLLVLKQSTRPPVCVR